MGYIRIEDIRTKADFPEGVHQSFFTYGDKYLPDVLAHLNHCKGCDQWKGSCICPKDEVLPMHTIPAWDEGPFCDDCRDYGHEAGTADCPFENA